MCDETPEERQDNEIEALKAIFAEELVDNRPNIAWKIWRPLDLLLTLHPLHSSSVAGIHCSVTLHFVCCPNYPDKPPKISLHKIQGLSNENGAKLLKELEDMAEKLCGEVMIFELAQHVQNFLHAFNKPTVSFYDEMMDRKQEMERLKQLDLQVKEDEERKRMKDEIQQRQEILKMAGRRHQRTSVSQSEDCERGDAPELVYYADNKMSLPKKSPKSNNADVPCNCSTKGVQIMRITQKNNRKIHLGRCLGHSPNGSTTFIAIDAETGDPLITKKWHLKLATDFQNRNKQITQIEQDLKTTSRLKHTSLTPYIGMEIQQETLRRTNYQCVYLYRDFVLGCSLKYVKSKLAKNDSDEGLRLLRHVGSAVFSALKELHSVGVVHRDVRLENVYLDECGAVKLVGVGLDVRLAEIHEGENYCERQTKAQDVFAAAQLLLSLVSDEGLDIPAYLPSSAKDFFSRCLTDDEQLQWSSERLCEHCFLNDTPARIVESQHDDGYSGSEDDDKVLAKSLVNNCVPASCHSRLSAEFEVLKWLGKGAFGDVLKVKNKLDGGFYAIKRIKLNPESIQLNKKITREVKLLSRLNHENVVRYFNAWIETISPALEDSSCSDVSVVKNQGFEDQNSPAKKNPQASMEAVLAKLAPGVKLEWSISEAPVKKMDEPVSEDDDDDEDGWFKRLPTTTALDETSSSIEFEVDTENQSETLPSEDIPEDSRPHTELIQQVLYIQMEFCEKNTLRQAIDNGLYMEHFRAWKLFREIVEGLAHVHQRGMIHRDLKPVNIFLDSNDHVKIGDFGLATKAFTGLPAVSDEKAKPPEEFGGSLTGQIGTALYVAPELLQAGNKVIYNQKVDIYSLGIILFEMFHPPLETGMERMKVLTELRTKDILMPESFIKDDNSKQIFVIRWLLNHEPSCRPTCPELLSSSALPRAVAPGALSGLLSHALLAPRSGPYRHLIGACLGQSFSPAEDYTYHTGAKNKPDVLLGAIKDAVVKVFKSHGASEFAPPLLIPKTKAWEQYPNAVKVMTAFGGVCHLPHDLRLPFARHTAYTETKYMRRFVVDRVFREKHVEGFHPKEMVECAFDIVTPKSDSLWPDAELLVVASKAASAVNIKVNIVLNHSEMLKVLLLCCGVPIDRHKDLYPILVDVRLGRITNLQLQTHLTSLCITNRDIANLLKLMETEVPVNELRDTVAPYARKGEWSRALTQAVTEIETVVSNAKALGLDCVLCAAPLLPSACGVSWAARAADRRADVIAKGGRYDSLVEDFWQIAKTEKEAKATLKSSSVGFSMSLERMANIAKKLDVDLANIGKGLDLPSVCVCVWGAASSGREGGLACRRAQLARDLWAFGCTVCTCHTNSASEAHELSGASVVLTDDDGCVCAVFWDDNRVREHRVPFIDALDFIKQKLNLDSSRTPDGPNRAVNWSENEKSNSPNVAVTFITSSEKMTKNSRRQCENQIYTHIISSLTKLGMSTIMSRIRVCVLALSCESAVVRSIAAHLDTPIDTDDLDHVIRAVSDCFPRRRKIIEETLQELSTMVSMQSNQQRSEETLLYALYSISDSVCRIIT